MKYNCKSCGVSCIDTRPAAGLLNDGLCTSCESVDVEPANGEILKTSLADKIIEQFNLFESEAVNAS